MSDLIERLVAATRTAMQSYPRSVDRERWVRETLLVALGSRSIAIIDVAELAQLRRSPDEWRMRCSVHAEQVEQAGLTVAMVEHWAATTEDVLLATAIRAAMAASSKRANRFVPSGKWWAAVINRETETTADAQRLLDAIVGASKAGP